MQIFEFHFNPKSSQDIVFDSFCYEPENFYEKRMGSLFILGEIKNALPQNSKFLADFSDFFKKKYYSFSGKLSLEGSLKETLKSSNKYLEEIAKKGDVSWLGNFNMTILNLKSKRDKLWEASFAKTGSTKVVLLRSGQIIDIGKNLEFEEIDPYPLKIFGKIVSGKLTRGDAVLILTKDVFDFFSQKPKLTASQKKSGRIGQSLLEKIAKTTILPNQLENDSPKKIDSELKETLKAYKESFANLQGSLLLIFLEKNISQKRKHSFVREVDLKSFSLSKIFKPVIQKIKKRLKIKAFKPKLKTPKVRSKKLKKNVSKIKAFLKHKNTVLILALILFLILGALIFRVL